MEYLSLEKGAHGIGYRRIYIKMSKELNKEEIKKIIKDELDDMIGHYNVEIQEVDVDLPSQRVNVTFGLSTVDDDDYIGLCFY